MSFDSKGGELLCLSDDRSQHGPARFYAFSLEINTNQFKTAPRAMTVLKNPLQQPFAPGPVDFEGMALSPQGMLFISSEGDLRQKPRLNPSVNEFRRDGSFVRTLMIPGKFLPEPLGHQSRGVSNNNAFESLTHDPDSQILVVAVESALIQDDTEATFEKGAALRVLRLALNSGKTQEFVYPLDPMPRLSTRPEARPSIGLSDLLAIGNGRYLALERGVVFVGKEVLTSVRIYRFTFDEADDVSSLESLRGVTYRPLVKKLVLDLHTITGQLSPGYQTLDNLEGMTLGPLLPNGNPTLLLVSDDNFNPSQRTQFLAFEMLGD